ncbi:sugar ABC transporter permease [Paenibacillus qinlingensis]|uniref:Multiple sugar transport system permease protein n=1 Tax=Paenibacillus qinlingensis TaxID=1837343 RepID=A0ABU1NSR3_9BACL|nr:sugar ABC transporter permease [Paenibacillus qinlingensis]MDR6550484.1 multiple sugar transport system permease protein [Paenibacillus qinlingensis]
MKQGKISSIRLRREISGWLFVLPMLLFFVLFVVYPILKAIKSSFYGFDYTKYYWSGLDNYRTIFMDPLFWKSIRNTLEFVLYLVPSITVIALMIAVTIHTYPKKMQSFFKAAFYIPGVTSIVSLTLVWQYIYNGQFGLGNYVLDRLGMDAVNWLGVNSATLALSVIVLTISVGSAVVVFSAALGGIPKDFYESASLDGAKPWHMFARITLPMLKPTLLYVVVTGTIGAFQVFAIIMIMTGGGPAYRTTTIMMLIYQQAFVNMNFGIANAMGIVLCIIISLIAFVQFKLLKSDNEY